MTCVSRLVPAEASGGDIYPLAVNHQMSTDLQAPSRLLPAEPLEYLVSKRTFQPNNRRRAKTHGFRLRMRTRAGRAILGARRRKGRAELSA